MSLLSSADDPPQRGGGGRRGRGEHSRRIPSSRGVMSEFRSTFLRQVFCFPLSPPFSFFVIFVHRISHVEVAWTLKSRPLSAEIPELSKLLCKCFEHSINLKESRFVLAVRLVSGRTSVRCRFGSPFSSEIAVCGQSCGFVRHN